MIEICFYGRGGQGAVTAAQILAKAAGYMDKYSQAFPAFGPERRGAPVKAFCRIDDKEITIRSQVYEPDYMVVLDSSLLNSNNSSSDLPEKSVLIINTKKMENKMKQKYHVFDATSLALEILGRDIVNTAMLGAFAKITGLVSLESMLAILGEVFKGKVLDMNKKLIDEAYKKVEV